MPSKYRKNYVYSSEHAMRICEGLIKDRSLAKKISESVLIENALLNTLLPKHRDAALWVEMMYDGETLADAYARAFCGLASTSYPRTNSQPLVEEFRHLVSQSIYRFSGKETPFQHLVNQLTYMLKNLPPNDPWHDYQLLERYIQQLKNDPMDVTALDITALIQRNFAVFSSSENAYQALMDIASMAAPALRDTPSLRIAYIDTLAKISEDW